MEKRSKINIIETHTGFIIARDGFVKVYFTPFENQAIIWFLEDEERSKTKEA